MPPTLVLFTFKKTHVKSGRYWIETCEFLDYEDFQNKLKEWNVIGEGLWAYAAHNVCATCHQSVS